MPRRAGPRPPKPTPLREPDEPEPPKGNNHLEQLLLGALLADNQRIADIGKLKPEHFAWEIHQKLFETIRGIIARDLPATPKTLAYMLNGEAPYVAQLVDSIITSTPHAVETWSKELIVLYYQRRVEDMKSDLQRIFHETTEEYSYLPRFTEVKHEFEQIFRESELAISRPALGCLDLAHIDERPLAPREWLVTNWLPMGETCGLGGAGGKGKTTIACQLATAAALGGGNGAWLGLPVIGMNAAILLCEDNPRDTRLRQEAINKLYGCTNGELAGRLMLIPRREADSNYLATFDENDNMQLTDFFHEFLDELRKFEAKLVVIDTLADVFRGDAINPAHARRFIRGCCDKIARELGGIVLLIYHPSIRGMQDRDYQFGSVQWDAAYRARIVMAAPPAPEDDEEESEEDKNTRILSLIKANFAPPDETVEIIWSDGVFRRKIPPDLAQANYEIAANLKKWCDVFLILLDKYTQQGRPLSLSPRGEYAPRIFAADNDRQRVTERQFKRAMSQLLDKQQIAFRKLPGARSPQLVRISPNDQNINPC